MIKSSNQKVTPYQSYILVLMTIIGTGILSLPRRIAGKAGNDSIWVVVVSCLIAWLLVTIMTKLCRRFPGDTIVEFSGKIFGTKNGSWIGIIGKILVLVAYGISWFITLSLVVRLFGEMIVSTILQRTPMEVISFTFLLFAMLIAGSKIELIAKFNELLYPLLFIPLLFFIIALIQKGEMTNLLPLFEINWSQFTDSLFESVFDLTGYNLILIFMAYYQTNKTEVTKHSHAMLFVLFFYLIAMTTSISIFGSEATAKMLWPTMETIRPLDFKIQVFERLESGIIVIWLVASFTTVVNMFAAFTDLFMRNFQIKEVNRKWTATVLLLPIFILAFIPENVSQLEKYMKPFSYYIVSVDFLIPLLLLSIAFWRKRKEDENSEETTSPS